jgi:hypothetical protein
MPGVISLELYDVALQAELLSTSTLPCWSLEGEEPPALKVPHPVIQQVVPGATSELGRLAEPTQLLNENELCNLISAMSASLVLEL